MLLLGKGDPKELEMLWFLGIIPLLKDQASFGHIKPQYLEIKIGDLENAMILVLKHLQKDGKNPICYQTEIHSIQAMSHQQAKIVLLDKSSNHFTNIDPTSVIVTDGFNGNTKNLLGVSQTILSKTTLEACSFFKSVDSTDHKDLESFQYCVINGCKGVGLMVKTLAYACLFGKSKEESFAQVMPNGPAFIFRVPAQDYLFRVFKKEEHGKEEKRWKDLQLLNDKIKRYQLKENTYKADLLEVQKKQLQNTIKLHLEEEGKNIHGILDFSQSLVSRHTHKMKKMPMQSIDHIYIPTVISKAEQPMVKIGKSLFLFRGDTCHTTDPYTGRGGKAALEETLADQYLFSHPNLHEVSLFELSILNWGQDDYQQKMIDKGFEDRLLYYPGTEMITRYCDFALKENLFSQKESTYFLRLCEKRKIFSNHPYFLFSSEDGKFSEELSLRLKERLEKAWKKKTDLSNIKEQQLLNRLYELIQSDSLSLLTDSEEKQLELLISRLSSTHHEEGWLLALIVENYKNFRFQI